MSSVSEGHAASQLSRAKSKAAEAAGAAQDALMDTAGEYAETARRAAEDVAHRTTEAGRMASNSVQEVASQFREAVERSVEKQPLTTVLLAIAAGVVLGGLMRR